MDVLDHVAGVQDHPKRGVLGAHRDDDRLENLVGGVGGGRETDRSRNTALVIARAFDGALPSVDHFEAAVDDERTFVGDVERSRRALEDADADRILDALHGRADRRRRQMQLLAGQGHRARLRNPHEQLHFADPHASLSTNH